jgi:hypothetical protein
MSSCNCNSQGQPQNPQGQPQNPQAPQPTIIQIPSVSDVWSQVFATINDTKPQEKTKTGSLHSGTVLSLLLGLFLLLSLVVFLFSYVKPINRSLLLVFLLLFFVIIAQTIFTGVYVSADSQIQDDSTSKSLQISTSVISWVALIMLFVLTASNIKNGPQIYGVVGLMEFAKGNIPMFSAGLATVLVSLTSSILSFVQFAHLVSQWNN